MRPGDLERILSAGGLGDFAVPLAELAAPAAKVTTIVSDEKLIPLGVSKFGGTPHVPRDFEWPVNADSPMNFLAQISFADFGPFQWLGWVPPFPKEGVLSLFADMETARQGDEPSGRVFQFPSSKGLVRWHDPMAPDSPSRAADPGVLRVRPFPPASVAFAQTLTLPELDEEMVARVGLPTELVGKYEAVRRDLSPPGNRHQVLGRSLYALEHKEDTLLAQFDSDDLLEWNWGPDRVLAFCMDEADLVEGDFREARMVLMGPSRR